MFLDNQTRLSSAQAVTATAVSTNAYDQGAPYSGASSASGAVVDSSVGEPLGLVFTVTVAAKVSATDETYTFQFIQSAAAALTSPTALAQVAFTNTQASTLLIAGAVIVVPMPSGSVTQRFLGANYVTAGTGPTMTVNCDILPLSDIQKQRFYTSAIVVK